MDTLDQTLAGDFPESPGGITPTEVNSGSIPIESTSKLGGRRKMFRSLQRLSSSPSLTRLGRSRASSYKIGGRGSTSCVSLSSSASTSYGHSHGQSYSSQSSAGLSTAPTSPSGSPGAAPDYFHSLNGPLGVRIVEDGSRLQRLSQMASCPVPYGVRPNSRGLALGVTHETAELDTVTVARPVRARSRVQFDLWSGMPEEIKMKIFCHLKPKEIIRCSSVCRSWRKLCYDGQLWRSLDASEFYRDIPAESLGRIITSAGPFVRDLNLRGCVQLQDVFGAGAVSEACHNLEQVSLEGCRLDRSSISFLLLRNSRLVHLNFTGLAAVSNATCKLIAQHCQQLQFLNVSWCGHMDARGVQKIVESCPNLRDLRASEIGGFDKVSAMQRIFESNRLERLVLSGCSGLSDAAVKVLVEGSDSPVCPISDRAMVPPRKLRHLDLSHCHELSDAGVRSLAHHVPELEGLQLGGCSELTDAGLSDLLSTVPNLTHLDLEEVSALTNSTLQVLAQAPCRGTLQHLSISYCENMGDTGMLAVVKACPALRNVEMDNTRISDLVLVEAASIVRERARRSAANISSGGLTTRCRPSVGLRLVVYDCQNVTWTGVREVLSRNAEVKRPLPVAPNLAIRGSYPTEIIRLKCFYGWQMTVEEHTRRVLKGDLAAASRLERKWAEFMMANEEAGAAGTAGRRRRRRAREAAMLHADEEEGGMAMAGLGRRRRARSGGCILM
ncbi:MAG: hypothetical protein M1825_006481 [Sarcosagium campestre]|nr:MAG: hypothetical protein M1825_006481 [Sarcosagium campestre]